MFTGKYRENGLRSRSRHWAECLSNPRPPGLGLAGQSFPATGSEIQRQRRDRIASDAASRLTSLGQNLSGTASVTYGYGHNPANRIVTLAWSNAAYGYAGPSGTTTYANTGLNQTTSLGGTTATWSAQGNLSSPSRAASDGEAGPDQLGVSPASERARATTMRR